LRLSKHATAIIVPKGSIHGLKIVLRFLLIREGKDIGEHFLCSLGYLLDWLYFLFLLLFDVLDDLYLPVSSPLDYHYNNNHDEDD
jgi:hypothetical protein